MFLLISPGFPPILPVFPGLPRGSAGACRAGVAMPSGTGTVTKGYGGGDRCRVGL